MVIFFNLLYCKFYNLNFYIIEIAISFLPNIMSNKRNGLSLQPKIGPTDYRSGPAAAISGTNFAWVKYVE